MIKLSLTFTLLLVCFALTACDTKTETPEKEGKTSSAFTATETNIKQSTTLNKFISAAEQAYNKLAKSGMTLQDRINNFINSPSVENLNNAKTALLDAHQHYMLIQVFQNIDMQHSQFDLQQNQPTVIHPLEIRLDQHPAIPGYLDAVPNFPHSGLTFSEQALTAEFLNNEHQFSDAAYVAIGFHALEIMLTGGLNQTPQERSLDFSKLSDTSNKSTPRHRRSLYVQLLTTIINDDLKNLSAAWTSNEGFYPQTLSNLLPAESKRLIQQAYKMEEHALSQIKEHQKDSHNSAIVEREAQLALLLKNPNNKQN